LTSFAALVLAASACGGSLPPMAVVNGVEITMDDLAALDPRYDDVGRLEEGALIDDLGLFVLLTAIETTARDQYGIEVTDADVDALFTSPSESEAARVAELESLVDEGSITEAQARSDARSYLVRRDVTDELVQDSDAMRDLWEQAPQAFATACVRHILTQLEEEAQAAAARVANGEDFAAVADEVSLDTQSQGGLLANPDTGECSVPLGVFVPEFGYEAAIAPIGEVTGPFVSDFGWHVIIVEERTAPESLEDVQANMDEYLTDDVRSALINPWLNDAIDDAMIEVDPQIGTWSEAGNAIVPAGEDG
jgi:parvulin-like peptidyl-prolyl isomerase